MEQKKLRHTKTILPDSHKTGQTYLHTRELPRPQCAGNISIRRYTIMMQHFRVGKQRKLEKKQ